MDQPYRTILTLAAYIEDLAISASLANDDFFSVHFSPFHSHSFDGFVRPFILDRVSPMSCPTIALSP